MDTQQRGPCSDHGPGIIALERRWGLLEHCVVSFALRPHQWDDTGAGLHLIYIVTLIDRWLPVIMVHRFSKKLPFIYLTDTLGDPHKLCNTAEVGWMYLLSASCRTCGSLGSTVYGPGWSFFKCSACSGPMYKLLLPFALKKSSGILDLYSSTSINQNPATLNLQVTGLETFLEYRKQDQD